VAAIAIGVLEFLFLFTAYRAWKTDGRKRRTSRVLRTDEV
jgi:hypothetical protein